MTENAEPVAPARSENVRTGALAVGFIAVAGVFVWQFGMFSDSEGHGYAQVCAQGGYRQPAVVCSQKQAHRLGPQARWVYVPPAAPVPKVAEKVTSASATPPRHSCVGQADDWDSGKAERVAWDSGSCGQQPMPMARGI